MPKRSAPGVQAGQNRIGAARPVHDRLAPRIRASGTGHDVPRSRGDREELSGGLDASRRGALVGGELLVRAVTQGPAGERLPGSLPDRHPMPWRPGGTSRG